MVRHGSRRIFLCPTTVRPSAPANANPATFRRLADGVRIAATRRHGQNNPGLRCTRPSVAIRCVIRHVPG